MLSGASQPRARGASRWIWWGLGLALLLTVSAAELEFRAARARPALPVLCDWDRALGCVMRPNTTAEIGWPQSTWITTNEYGLRGPAPHARTAFRRRLLLLGDSVSFGPTVGDKAHFATRLESVLRPQGISVINGGQLYFRGTEQELAWFADAGVQLQPDLVVLLFNDRTDFGYHGMWKRGPLGLERAERPGPSLRQWLVLQTSGSLLADWLEVHSRLFGWLQVHGWNPVDSDRSGPDVQATEDALVELQRQVQASGSTLAILEIPGPRLGDSTLARLAQRHGIPLLNPSDHMAALREEYQASDGQLTPSGHELIATLLAADIPRWLASAHAQNDPGCHGCATR